MPPFESRRERELWLEEKAHDEWVGMQPAAARKSRDVVELDPLDRDPADDAFDPDDPNDERLLDGYRKERQL